MTRGAKLHPGAKWEFVNRTLGTVTPYTLESAPATDGDSAMPVRLRNDETDGVAQVWARSLLRPSSTRVSHWRPA